MIAEAGDGGFALAAQFAHAVQEGHLRRARALGAVEQGIVEPPQRLAERTGQRRQYRAPGLLEQTRTASQSVLEVGVRRHTGIVSVGVRLGGMRSPTAASS